MIFQCERSITDIESYRAIPFVHLQVGKVASSLHHGRIFPPVKGGRYLRLPVACSCIRRFNPPKVLFTNMQAGNTMGLAQQRCLRFGVHNQLSSTVPLPQYRYAHAETRTEADWSVQGRGRTRCRLTFKMEEHHLGIRGLPIQHTQGATRGIN